MPRIVKPAQDRRRELLDCAFALLLERGYEATSVADVIACAGISKGAFYHHFVSKEALLEALAQRFAEDLLVHARDVLEDETLNAYERLVGYLERARQLKLQQAPQVWTSFEPIFKPENLALYHRLHAAIRRIMTPVFTRIIEQGIAERSFDTPDARGAAETLLLLGSGTYDAVQAIILAADSNALTRAAAALEQRLQVLGITADRLLGLPDGCIRFAPPGYVDALLATRARSDQGAQLAS